MSDQNNKQDLVQVFALLYGREPSDTEVQDMQKYGVHLAESPRQIARRIIACMDRQTLPTSFHIRFENEDLRLVQREGFKLFFDESDVAVGRTIGAGHKYEEHILSVMKEFIKTGMNVIDVGANIGYFSMVASNLTGESGVVFACEPNSENCRLILSSVIENSIKNVNLFPVAAGDRNGYAYFTPAMGSNGTLMPSLSETLKNPNCIVVPICRLDDIINHKIDFIKMDVEGAEPLVQKGAKNIIESNKPVVVAEFCPTMIDQNSGSEATCEFLKYFDELGYRSYLLNRDEDSQARDLIENVGDFLSNYKDPNQISDILFVYE